MTSSCPCLPGSQCKVCRWRAFTAVALLISDQAVICPGWNGDVGQMGTQNIMA